MPIGPELQLLIEYGETEAAFLDAKKNRDKDPDGYAKAKAKLHKLRVYWRQIDEMVGTRANGAAGVAVAQTVAAGAEVRT